MTRHDDDREYLLPRAYRAFHDAPGWRPSTYVSDEHGRVAFRADHPVAGPSLVACKRELWNGQVSLTLKVTRVAIPERRTVVVCLGERPTPDRAWAFDARRVVNAAPEPRTIRRSKRARDVPARHVDPDEHGVELRDWLAGRAALPGPREDDGVRDGSLAEWGVVA